MEAHTEKLIAKLTNAQLVELYNAFAPNPVKKFSDSRAAQRRVLKVLQESGLVLRESAQVESTEDLVEVDGYFAVPVETASEAPKPRTSKTEYKDSYRIEVRVGQNPKRRNSKSHARFELYRDGMTVGEYKAACVELEGADARLPYEYLADLHWDEARQFITVWTPELVDELDAEERRYAPANEK